MRQRSSIPQKRNNVTLFLVMKKKERVKEEVCVCLIFIELLNINILVFGNNVHIILNTSQNSACSYLLTPYFGDSSWLVLLLHDQQCSRFNCICMKDETSK